MNKVQFPALGRHMPSTVPMSPFGPSARLHGWNGSSAVDARVAAPLPVPRRERITRSRPHDLCISDVELTGGMRMFARAGRLRGRVLGSVHLSRLSELKACTYFSSS